MIALATQENNNFTLKKVISKYVALRLKNNETEKYICIENNTIERFARKWALTSGCVLL